MRRHFWTKRGPEMGHSRRRDGTKSARGPRKWCFQWNVGISPLKDLNFPQSWQTHTMQWQQGAIWMYTMVSVSNIQAHCPHLGFLCPSFWPGMRAWWSVRVYLWALARAGRWNPGHHPKEFKSQSCTERRRASRVTAGLWWWLLSKTLEKEHKKAYKRPIFLF